MLLATTSSQINSMQGSKLVTCRSLAEAVDQFHGTWDFGLYKLFKGLLRRPRDDLDVSNEKFKFFNEKFKQLW